MSNSENIIPCDCDPPGIMCGEGHLEHVHSFTDKGEWCGVKKPDGTVIRTNLVRPSAAFLTRVQAIQAEADAQAEARRDLEDRYEILRNRILTGDTLSLEELNELQRLDIQLR